MKRQKPLTMRDIKKDIEDYANNQQMLKGWNLMGIIVLITIIFLLLL